MARAGPGGADHADRHHPDHAGRGHRTLSQAVAPGALLILVGGGWLGNASGAPRHGLSQDARMPTRRSPGTSARSPSRSCTRWSPCRRWCWLRRSRRRYLAWRRGRAVRPARSHRRAAATARSRVAFLHRRLLRPGLRLRRRDAPVHLLRASSSLFIGTIIVLLEADIARPYFGISFYQGALLRRLQAAHQSLRPAVHRRLADGGLAPLWPASAEVQAQSDRRRASSSASCCSWA